MPQLISTVKLSISSALVLLITSVSLELSQYASLTAMSVHLFISLECLCVLSSLECLWCLSVLVSLDFLWVSLWRWRSSTSVSLECLCGLLSLECLCVSLWRLSGSVSLCLSPCSLSLSESFNCLYFSSKSLPANSRDFLSFTFFLDFLLLLLSSESDESVSLWCFVLLRLLDSSSLSGELSLFRFFFFCFLWPLCASISSRSSLSSFLQEKKKKNRSEQVSLRAARL